MTSFACSCPLRLIPTSGFIIMVPATETIELDMDVESALKMIVSLGVVVPEWKRRELVSETPDG